MKSFRLLSGIRPTGPLHLGHYLSLLKSLAHLQHRFECFLCIADLHVLTSQTKAPQFIEKILRDTITTGIDPLKTTYFIQSHIPEHGELCSILSMFTQSSWLTKISLSRHHQDLTTGLLNYPVLMASDIMLYNAHFVLVGRDQVPHIEIVREIIRKVRKITQVEALIDPTFIVAKDNYVAGVDGKKMSKTYGNVTPIKAPEYITTQQTNTTQTDPCKLRCHSPGNPRKCIVWSYHHHLTPDPLSSYIFSNCLKGCITCEGCKRALTNNFLRLSHKNSPPYRINTKEIFMRGTQRAREQAIKTISILKRALGLNQ